jgi:dTDP-4-dehydrorhamnose reductase
MENETMKILVTGYTGQLGYDVVQNGLSRDFDMIGVGSKDLNITDEYAVKKYVRTLKPDAIIHCGAYTAVDKAEDDKENCWKVNVEGTRYLVQAAQEIKAKFMYISTDYIFDGLGDKPFVETDLPHPIGYYGLTKYEGEKMVQAQLTEWFIVRISWVFGINGNNFVKTMMRLSEHQNEIKVVGDQVGSPTYTFDAARLIIDMIQTDKYGIYHATNEGFCSWSEFAKEIFRITGKKVKVKSISTEEYPTRAKRPKNSRLSKKKIIDNGFKTLPPWQSLKHFLKNQT